MRLDGISLCLIQRNNCIRQHSHNKNPRFLHRFSFVFMPNLNVGLGAAILPRGADAVQICTAHPCTSEEWMQYCGVSSAGAVGACTVDSSCYATCKCTNPGYIFRIGYGCVCNPGYYDRLLECVKCPADSNGIPVSSNATPTKITHCYAESNRPVADKSGTWVYVNNCYYSN